MTVEPFLPQQTLKALASLVSGSSSTLGGSAWVGVEWSWSELSSELILPGSPPEGLAFQHWVLDLLSN